MNGYTIKYHQQQILRKGQPSDIIPTPLKQKLTEAQKHKFEVHPLEVVTTGGTIKTAIQDNNKIE